MSTTQDQIAKLSQDREFVAKLHSGDVAARAEWDRLNKQLAAESTPSNGNLAAADVADAQAQIDKLSQDKEFVAKLQAQDPGAVAQWTGLHRTAAGELPGSRGGASLVR